MIRINRKLSIAILILVLQAFPTFSQNDCFRVKWHQKIATNRGNFSVILDNGDSFGRSVAKLGDLNGDGFGDIAVGAINDDDGGSNVGAIYILFLDANGQVQSHQKISNLAGGLTPTLGNSDIFGTSIHQIGDLDNDGVPDLAVGAPWDDDGGSDKGAVYILYLNSNGTVKSQAKISQLSGGFTGTLTNGNRFGIGIASIGDLDGDGINDLAVGASNDNDGGTERGAVWILFLNQNGTVKSHQKISSLSGGFSGPLDNGDFFGNNIAAISDFNGGFDIAVAAAKDDDGGTDKGAVYILSLDTNGTVKSEQKISSTAGGFTGVLNTGDIFGDAVSAIGDLNADGTVDLVVAASLNDDGGNDRGAVWLLLMNPNATVKQDIKISDLEGNFIGNLQNDDIFGHAVAGLGDYNNDGYTDIAVGAYDDVGGTDKGAVWLLTLEQCPDTCVPGNQETFQKIFVHGGNDKGHSVIQTLDNGYLIAGEMANGNAGGSDILVMKTDQDGDTLWTRTFGSSGNETGSSITIRQTADTGYVLAGRTYGFGLGSHAYIIKLDAAGDIEWEKAIGGNDPSGHARAIEQTADGGYIIAGSNGGYIVRLNANGSMRWNRYRSGGGNMHLTSVKETPEHDFVFAGHVQYGAGNYSGWGLKLDTLGNKLWEKVYDIGLTEGLMSVSVAHDGGYLFAGYSGSSIFSSLSSVLMKTDTAGKIIWGRSYQSGLQIERAVHLVPTTDNGYIFSVATLDAGTGGNTIIKIDDSGNPQWAKAFPGNSVAINTYFGYNIQQTNDEGYIFTDYSSTFSTDEDVYLIKMNNCGESGCNESDPQITVQEFWPSSITNPNFPVTSFGTVKNLTSITGYFPVQDSILCEDLPCQLTTEFRADTVCFGDTTHFTDLSVDLLANINEWKWDFGDGDILNGIQNPSHLYAAPGIYNVKLYVSNDDTLHCTDSIIKKVFVPVSPTPDLGEDSTLCYGDTLILNAIHTGATYLWQDNSSNALYRADTTGAYFVEVAIGNCSTADTIDLLFQLPPSFSLGNDSTLCTGDSLLLHNSVAGYTYTWQDNSTDTALLATTPGVYWQEASNGICTVRDSIALQFDLPPAVDLGNDSTLCYGDTLTLDASQAGATYRWQDNSNAALFNADTTGLYHVTVALGSCEVSDSIALTFDLPPLVELGEDSVLCTGETLLLNASTPGFNYRWQDLSSAPSFLADTTGTFFVAVSNGICEVKDSIDLIFEQQLNVELGDDTTLCEGNTLSLDVFNFGAAYLWNDNTTAPSLLVTQEGTYWVMLTSAMGSCMETDTIEVQYDELPVIDLGADTALCQGDSLLLDASFPGAAYRWQDNSSAATFLVTVPGAYSVTASVGACQSNEQIAVTFDSIPVFDLGENKEFCQGDSLILEIDNQWHTYLWSTGDTLSSITLDSSGKYWLRVTNGACSAADTVALKVNPLPERPGQNSYLLCDGEPVNLNAGNPGASYRWSTGDTSRTLLLYQPAFPEVTITLPNGCSLSKTFVVAYCKKELFIPNTITPNGDGKNDSWIIRNIDGYPGNKVLIFNRNGYLLFETTNYQNNWNGTYEGEALPATVYYYILDLNDGTEARKGPLTIIREK